MKKNTSLGVSLFEEFVLNKNDYSCSKFPVVRVPTLVQGFAFPASSHHTIDPKYVMIMMVLTAEPGADNDKLIEDYYSAKVKSV